jgi:lipopolysaccharide transport system ATP-binding protein
MSPPVISAESLSKRYLIGHQAERERYTALRDVVGRTAKGLMRSAKDMVHGRAIVPGDTQEEFWALKDVSFEIGRGEVVGIIGRNGAGKSTLLKILSRITEPTEGRVTITGRVASLLEVGTGFHPELTGRENIFLNGAILGMTRGEIRKKFDEIVAFAEIDKFLDTPVKRYSSGMYVRLAFAVAAHLEPEILVVDEVLAVGDAAFQRKCIGKMQDVAGGGRTVLFVSHNMSAVRRLCSRGLLLSSGRLTKTDRIDPIVAHHLQDAYRVDDARLGWNVWEGEDRPGREKLRVRRCTIQGRETGRLGIARTDETVAIACEYDQYADLPGARLVFTILSATGDIAFASTDHDERAPDAYPPGRYTSRCLIPPRLLNNGIYHLQIRAGVPGQEELVPDTPACAFRIEGPPANGSSYDSTWPGIVCPALAWHVEKAFT